VFGSPNSYDIATDGTAIWLACHGGICLTAEQGLPGYRITGVTLKNKRIFVPIYGVGLARSSHELKEGVRSV
jgi:hypothetical protein